MTPENPQDRALVEGLRRGEARAIEAFDRQYGGRIQRLVTSLLPDPLDAERVTRDVLDRVVRDIHAYGNHPAFLSWVYRLALETARERARTRIGPGPARRAGSRRGPRRSRGPGAPGARGSVPSRSRRRERPV